MKHILTTWLALVVLVLTSMPALAQQEGDYRTRNDGDWSNAQIWQRFNGSAWVNIGTPPTGAETVTVLADDSVFVDVPLSITGTLVNQGIVDTEGNLTISDGGVYQHDRDEGEIADITWAEGSTLLVTGVVATAPENRNQNYHNIVFNTPGQLSNLNMNLDEVTIGGDITVISSGLGRWYLTSAAAMDSSVITILGDVNVQNGAFSVQGTSNSQTTFIVEHHGDIHVTGGNFSISRGSQGLGTTTWILHEGDFAMSNAVTQSSTITPGGAKFVFTKDGTQTLTLENVDFRALPIEVDSGTTLDMGASTLGGSGDFTLNEGAGLATTVPGGIEEIFALVTGAVTLAEDASFTFNGTEAQVTSTMMPAVVDDLTINNAAGVTLSQETTINGVLRLQAGVFDNTIPFTLGPNGSISYEGGELLNPVANEPEDILPKAFYVDQNFPNPFNPATVIRYGLPVASEVTISVYNMLGQEVRSISEGFKNAGTHEAVFEAGSLSSGVYIYRVSAGDRVASHRMTLLE